MFSVEIRFCVGLVGSRCSLPIWKESDFFFFSMRVSFFIITLERSQQFQLHVCLECFYIEWMHYIPSCLFQTGLLSVLVQWIPVLWDFIFFFLKSCGSKCHEENILHILKHLIKLQLERSLKILVTQEMSLGISSSYMYFFFSEVLHYSCIMNCSQDVAQIFSFRHFGLQ